MKTAKDLLKEKNYEKFDFEKACNEIETFFLENKESFIVGKAVQYSARSSTSLSGTPPYMEA